VLVVDDDPDFVMAARAALESGGFIVDECSTAKGAMSKTREFRPDLLVLDVMMETGTAGFSLSYQVRSDPALARLPILMVTALHKTTPLRFSPEKDGEYLPVQQLLDKPVPAEKLLAAVRELLAGAGGQGK
jgi:two-component system cell cycle response regulator